MKLFCVYRVLHFSSHVVKIASSTISTAFSLLIMCACVCVRVLVRYSALSSVGGVDLSSDSRQRSLGRSSGARSSGFSGRSSLTPRSSQEKSSDAAVSRCVRRLYNLPYDSLVGLERYHHDDMECWLYTFIFNHL